MRATLLITLGAFLFFGLNQATFAIEGTLNCNLDYQSFKYSDFSKHIFNTPFSIPLNTDNNLGPIPIKILDPASDSSLKEEFTTTIRVAASKISVQLKVSDLSGVAFWDETKEIQTTGEPAVFKAYEGESSKNLNRIKITSAVCTFKSLKKNTITDTTTKVMPAQIDSVGPISNQPSSTARPLK